MDLDKINKVIFVLYYVENSASANRIFALSKEFSKLNINVYLILSSRTDFITPEIEGVQVVKIVSNGIEIYKRISNYIQLLYSDKTVVYSYDNPIICAFLPKRINVFCEYTEIPYYGRKKTLMSIIKTNIKLLISRRLSGIFVITHNLKQYYLQLGFKNVQLLNMFVDHDRFTSDKFIDDSEPYIGYCGTISEFKDGVDNLIFAFEEFYKFHPEYSLFIMGPFESENTRNYLMSIVNDLNSASAIRFTGSISHKDMPQYLSKAKILALARPDNEQARFGFPTKLGEYLATGKPVIVTDVGEISQYLTNNENSFLVQPNDSRHFADKMIWIADNYEQACLVGSKGRELSKMCFSVESQAKVALDFMSKRISYLK